MKEIYLYQKLVWAETEVSQPGPKTLQLSASLLPFLLFSRFETPIGQIEDARQIIY